MGARSVRVVEEAIAVYVLGLDPHNAAADYGLLEHFAASFADAISATSR
jgi:hypothetical protein